MQSKGRRFRFGSQLRLRQTVGQKQDPQAQERPPISLTRAAAGSISRRALASLYDNPSIILNSSMARSDSLSRLSARRSLPALSPAAACWLGDEAVERMAALPAGPHDEPHDSSSGRSRADIAAQRLSPGA